VTASHRRVGLRIGDRNVRPAIFLDWSVGRGVWLFSRYLRMFILIFKLKFVQQEECWFSWQLALNGEARQVFGLGWIGEIEGQQRFIITNVGFDAEGSVTSGLKCHSEPLDDRRLRRVGS